jgi:hypothetical protein
MSNIDQTEIERFDTQSAEHKMESTMGEDESVNVVIFGEHLLRGTVKTVDDRSTTIGFGTLDGWSVTVPLAWIRKRTDGWFVEIA